MAEITLSTDALADFRAALRRYADYDAQTARRFQAAFDAVIDTLTLFPEIGLRTDDQHRYFALRKFPYGLVYRATTKGVLVVGVPHDRQLPKDWAKRV